MTAALLQWFATNGRTLPWRTQRSAYCVIVSECMLQQTQVERVVPAFEAFVARWPTFASLAAASRADVVRAWRGLGYNSRALRLHELARAVEREHGGVLPQDITALRALPGIGPYTAAAVRAFAYGLDDVAIDTNIRRIVHRLRFGIEHPPRARAREIDAAARELLPSGKAYAWNSAMMDLGATICSARAPKCLLCPLQDSCAAAPIDAAAIARRSPKRLTSAARFETTDRFARGRIIDRLRALPANCCISLLDLQAELTTILPAHGPCDVERLLAGLVEDSLVEEASDGFSLHQG